jgi:putative transposase
MSSTEKRQLVVSSHPRLSLKRQCEILGVARSLMYYKPKGESNLNERLMKHIDKYFLIHPYYGVERMTDYLNKDLGYQVNYKRVQRLYKIMNLKTIYARPSTTKRDPTKYVYPYLLRNLFINRPNQVWQTDITYIPLFRGFMYMAAIIDVYSRKILGWSVSNSMTKEWCTELLEGTIKKNGKPEIHNSDQGSQYTSDLYIQALKKHEIQISMDGKGRALDNVYIERFWRSLKQEKIYLNPPNGGLDLFHKVQEYVHFYNTERRHTEIGSIPPNQQYFKHKMVG